MAEKYSIFQIKVDFSFFHALVINPIQNHFGCEFHPHNLPLENSKKLGFTNDQHDIYPELAAERSPLPTKNTGGLCVDGRIETNPIVKCAEWFLHNRYLMIFVYSVVQIMCQIILLLLSFPPSCDLFRPMTYFAGRGLMHRNLKNV